MDAKQDIYLDWNQKLAGYFFNENMAGREVLLYASLDLIEEVGTGLGGVNGFIQAVKTGPSWINDNNVCGKAYKLFQHWKFDRSGDFPPYIAYLASFVLANYIEGDFDRNAYYPRLKSLLELEHESSHFPYFDKMYELWDDLEKWSKEERGEELGSFTARIRGGKIHIGLPLSQAILSKKERDQLPVVFDEAGLEPGANPAEQNILNLLRKFGSKYLDKKTLRLVNSNEDKDLINALIDFVKEELIAWDGTLPYGEAGNKTSRTRSVIKICLQIEPLSKKVTSCLRLKSNYDFPVDGLSFTNQSSGQIELGLTCRRSTQFWTTPLKQNNQKLLDAFDIDWSNSLLLVDTGKHWLTAMRGAKVKLFKKGSYEQLPDSLVESSGTLERNVEFAVACHPNYSESIGYWINDECESLKPVITLHNGWSLFQAKNARASYAGVNELALSSQVTVRLRNGIKFGKSTAFINYCVPKVFIENAAENVEVTVSGRAEEIIKLCKEEGGNSWVFPVDLPVNHPLKIHVLEGGTEIKVNGNRVVIFDDGQTPLHSNYDFNRVARMPSGRLEETKLHSTYASGAKTFNYSLPGLVAQEFPVFSSDLTVTLLGQRPGEIIELDQDVQMDWQPVWALVKTERKRWQIQFCANDINVPPLPKINTIPASQIKQWKRFIWTNRMVNDHSQLQLVALKRLWEAYKNAASKL